MPQLNVLCCHSCKMFQTHIFKKPRKWECKLCHSKQSVQQIYFQGSGRDCRKYVQQMNTLNVNDFVFLLSEHNSVRTNDNYEASASVSCTSYTDNAVESTETKYLDSEKENLSDTRDLASYNVSEIKDVMSSENSL